MRFFQAFTILTTSLDYMGNEISAVGREVIFISDHIHIK